METDNRTFFDWWEDFTDKMYKRGYTRPLDKDQAMSDFENGITVDEAVSAFLEE